LAEWIGLEVVELRGCGVVFRCEVSKNALQVVSEAAGHSRERLVLRIWIPRGVGVEFSWRLRLGIAIQRLFVVKNAVQVVFEAASHARDGGGGGLEIREGFGLAGCGLLQIMVSRFRSLVSYSDPD
jgi:hypothetical protein